MSLPATQRPSEPEPAPAPSAPPSGADLSRAALFADPDDTATDEPEATTEDPDTILDSDDPDDTGVDPEPEKSDDDETEEEPPAKPAPTSDTPGHAPRTDVDISGSGSLFDL